jgi:antibiotic biosynthesis monooxygenase (ABM) superfamily enzyme
VRGTSFLPKASWLHCTLAEAADSHQRLEETRSMDKKGLLIVMARVRPEDEEAFNKWYNEDHLPKAIERFPGVLSGRRYKIMEGDDEYQYLAMYEFESCETMQATAGSEIMRELAREFDEAFGKGGRKRILAEQIKALAVG